MVFTPHTIGSKYRQYENATTKEIAKMIRNDLKKFKGVKFSVRMEHYNCINVRIIECSFNPYVDEYNVYLKTDDLQYYREHFEGRRSKIYNGAGKILLEEVTKVFNAYNYDDSDSMTDYFSTNYYGTAEYDYECKFPDLKSMSYLALLAGQKQMAGAYHAY